MSGPKRGPGPDEEFGLSVGFVVPWLKSAMTNPAQLGRPATGAQLFAGLAQAAAVEPPIVPTATSGDRNSPTRRMPHPFRSANRPIRSAAEPDFRLPASSCQEALDWMAETRWPRRAGRASTSPQEYSMADLDDDGEWAVGDLTRLSMDARAGVDAVSGSRFRARSAYDSPVLWAAVVLAITSLVVALPAAPLTPRPPSQSRSVSSSARHAIDHQGRASKDGQTPRANSRRATRSVKQRFF